MMYQISKLLVLVFLSMIFSAQVLALPFGTFNPRSVAMGGTGVASATSASAGFFNPAMLSQYKVRKEEKKNSRFIFPIINHTNTRNVENLIDIEDSGYETRINSAVDNFNEAQRNAQPLVNVSNEIQSDLDAVAATPIYSDSNVGIVLGIGARHEGGSLIINQRFVVDGNIQYSDEDRRLLNSYINEAQSVADGNAPDVNNTELYDAGTLINPTDAINTNGSATALNITTLSMAMSKEFDVFNWPIMFGITPKFVRVNVYDSSTSAANNFNSETVKTEYDFEINLDFGMATRFAKKWTGGLVIKNIRERSYDTGTGGEVIIGPQLRAGVSYISSRFLSYAVDFDLTENDPIGSGDPTQMLGAGLDWDARWAVIRTGISSNLAGTGDNKKPLYAVGIHKILLGASYDLSYALNENQQSISLQIGSNF